MSDWHSIRALARECHAAALDRCGGSAHVTALLDAAEALTEIQRVPVPAGNALLDGGDAQLDADIGIIFFNCEADRLLIPFYQAHEYAHHWLKHGPHSCVATELDPGVSEDPIPLGAQRVEGYGPKERRERAANVFAREFLLPTPLARSWFVDEGLTAAAIAERTGLPEGIVLHQFTRALLVPEIVGETDVTSDAALLGRSEQTAVTLDASQAAAAFVERGPLLVEAGPGTGKTRTLIGRIGFLLQRGTPPASILALTFSNKAAEEMRERVAQAAPEAAPHISMGTFHAFGLDLLRKFGTRIGLPVDPRVLDPVEAFMLLERELPALDLDHYQNLYEPTTYLRDILGAISRAKDELIDPDAYAALAARMLSQATTPETAESATRAAEVAQIYSYYQRRLAEEGWIDFGDLVARSVDLLRAHPDVREHLRRTYPHILVDEYQDVNRASGLLLQEVAGTGAGLWVVGDVRQAIYRFRGAAPSNMRRFDQDFPGAQRRTLERNYRSQPAIIDIVAGFAPQMRATEGLSFTPWKPDRADAGGGVFMHIADDLETELRGLAAEIERQRTNGTPYHDQAVLCRSHTTLARVANGLEAAGISVLYFGDLFERPEIRDLLALLSLACEGDGRGLVRVARFAEYRIPLADVLTLLEMAREQDIRFPEALKLAHDSDAISAASRSALARLEAHLDGVHYGSNAWGLLTRYLFERSRYLQDVLADTSTNGQQARLAIYQFLQFAHDQRGESNAGGSDSKREFLRLVRRLEIYNEERHLRQVPSWATGLDAVRLLTIHASKGLEFGAVYLPVLGGRYFPTPRRHQSCPPPVGMLADARDSDHDEEEEGLFFVALSRARDVLALSRALRYGNQSSNPSRLLSSIAHLLPNRPDGEATWLGAASAELLPQPPEASLAAGGALPVFEARELDVYIGCPRQYFYEFVLQLSGRREDAAYVQFHRCVYRVLAWLAEEQLADRSPTASDALAVLDEAWEQHGPVGHAYENLYREQAGLMIERALRRASRGVRTLISPTWEVQRPRGRIRLRPDRVELEQGASAGAPVVRRLRTGRPTTSESDTNIYALYQSAASAAYPSSTVETLYLSTDETRIVNLKDKPLKTRLGRYDAAISGIIDGEFSPKPNDRRCPRCPHYFICPIAEDL